MKIYSSEFKNGYRPTSALNPSKLPKEGSALVDIPTRTKPKQNTPYATPWDYVFDKKEPYWVIVNLKNGKRIGGMFSENSEASAYPHKGQIYLEKTCVLDDNGGFQSVDKNSKGVIILEGEISNIEFLGEMEK